MLQMSNKPATIGAPYNGNMMALGNTGGAPTRAAPGAQPAMPSPGDSTGGPATTTGGGNLFQMASQPGAMPAPAAAPQGGAMAFDTGAAAGPMQSAGQVTVSDNSLVSKQLGSLLSSDSPYMQLAKTRALQESNARGLANSSMAIGAGQAAAIDRALPIAQQDANTYGTTDRFNVEQGNLFARDANNFGRESALRKLGIFADMETQGRDQTFRRDERLGSQEFQSGENRADRDWRTGERIGGQEFAAGESALDRTFNTERDAVNFSRELERMGFASKLEQSRLAPQFTLAIAERTQAGVQAIMADPNIEPEAKRIAIQNLVDYQNNTIQWAETFFGVSINKMPGGSPAPGAAAPPIFNVPGAPAPMPATPGAAPGAAPAPGGFVRSGDMGLGNRWNEDMFGAALPQ